MRESPVRVLLVDDQGDVRALLRRALGRFVGLEVVGEATNGMEAVRAAAELKPDLIVLDLNMPGGRGEVAVPDLRGALPAVKIAVLSGDETTPELRDGVDLCLKKGASMREIVAELVTLAREITPVEPWDVN